MRESQRQELLSAPRAARIALEARPYPFEPAAFVTDGEENIHVFEDHDAAVDFANDGEDRWIHGAQYWHWHPAADGPGDERKGE
jgi:hypothetical protein